MTFAMFCTNCGAARAERDIFCRTCGHSLRINADFTSGQRADAAGTQMAQGAASTLPAPVAAPAPAPVPDSLPSSPPAAIGINQTVESRAAPAIGADRTVRLPLAGLITVIVGASAAATTIAVAVAVLLSGRPTPTDPPPTTGDVRVVDVANIRAELPSNWDITRRAPDTITTRPSPSRILSLQSAGVPTPMSMDALQERLVELARSDSPDADFCAGPETAPLPGGPSDGRYFVICSTLIPQGGGPAARLADAYYLGVSPDGLVVVSVRLSATPDTIEGFAGQVRDLPDPVWKLLAN